MLLLKKNAIFVLNLYNELKTSTCNNRYRNVTNHEAIGLDTAIKKYPKFPPYNRTISMVFSNESRHIPNKTRPPSNTHTQPFTPFPIVNNKT